MERNKCGMKLTRGKKKKKAKQAKTKLKKSLALLKNYSTICKDTVLLDE